MQPERGKPASNEILAVAARLFAERGFSNVSIRDVCREAGTTAPMIYYYFKDKKGLFRAAVNDKISMHEFILLLKDAAGAPDLRKGVSAFVDVYLRSFPADAFDPGLYLSETAKLDNKSAKMVVKQLDEIHRIAAAMLEKGMETDGFRHLDPGKTADCLIGMLNHVVFQKIHFSRSSDVSETESFIIRFFLNAITKA